MKSIADPSVVTCDEIISVMDIVSTKMTNNITTNAFFFSIWVFLSRTFAIHRTAGERGGYLFNSQAFRH